MVAPAGFSTMQITSFNPCFIGSCSRIQASTNPTEHGGRFNPCFIGSCSRIPIASPNDARLDCFNPCFIGSCSRIRRKYERRAENKIVSILVLLDLAHEFCYDSWFDSDNISFNPCFIGSCSRIGFSTTGLASTYEVSILVLLDLAHEFNPKLLTHVIYKFQSLFYWILLTNSLVG